MPNPVIQKSTFEFLKKLTRNNNRDWFNKHRGDYEEAKENAEQFMDGLIASVSVHDQLENYSGKKSLYRIYNDVRFSKDKSPYTARFSGYLKRAKPFLRGGYYIRIKPGDSRVSCGYAHPNPEDLKRIRLDIADNSEDWRKLLKSIGLRKNFGTMQGELVKTAPRGFDNDHPSIDLLRYKQFWFVHQFSDEEVLSPGFIQEINKVFKSIRPFFDYTSEVLTTDLNGISLF